LVANRVIELKNFNFWTYGKNSEIKRQPVGKEGSGKEMRTGVPVTV
jgi:hypothetical protein